MRTRAEALASAITGRVLWIEIEPIEAVDAARGANRATIDATLEGTFDAAVIGPVEALDRGIAAARARVRPGGTIAIVSPVEREGMRAAAQRAALVFDRKARVRALEDLCALLLAAGASRVEVVEIEGARGEAVIVGRV